MAEVSVEPERVRRLVLRRQHLAPDAGATDIEGLAEDLVGLHATGTTGPYLQAFARLPGFRKDVLDRALYAERSLVRVRCMRGTVFILPPDLARIAAVATRAFVEPRSVAFLVSGGVTEREYRALADRIEAHLAGSLRSVTATGLRARLGVTASLSGVLNLMCDQGRLVRDRPSGTWRSRAFSYRLADLDLRSGEPEEASRVLVARYVARYGPVSTGDVAWWTGLPLRDVHAALGTLGADVVSISVAGWPEACLIRAADLDALRGGELEGSAVVLLPELDPYTMGYPDKVRSVPTRWRDFVFDRAGNATSVILLDGLVMGVWGTSAEPEPVVRVHLFGGPQRRLLARVRRAAAELGRFWHDQEARVEEVREMAPLRGRPAGSVLAPLAPRAG